MLSHPLRSTPVGFWKCAGLTATGEVTITLRELRAHPRRTFIVTLASRVKDDGDEGESGRRRLRSP